MSLLWQTVTDTVKTGSPFVSVSIFFCASLHVPHSSHTQDTYCTSVYLQTHTDAHTHQHKLLRDLDWWHRQKAFGCWIFHISILDSFHLSVSWPSRWEVRYGLACLSLFGEIQQSNFHPPFPHFFPLSAAVCRPKFPLRSRSEFTLSSTVSNPKKTFF